MHLAASKRAGLQDTPQMPQRAQAAASSLRKIGDGSCASNRSHERWTGGAPHSQTSTPIASRSVAYGRGGAPRAALIHPSNAEPNTRMLWPWPVGDTPAGTTAGSTGSWHPTNHKPDVTVGQVGVQSRQHLPSDFAPALDIEGHADPSGLQASLERSRSPIRPQRCQGCRALKSAPAKDLSQAWIRHPSGPRHL